MSDTLTKQALAATLAALTATSLAGCGGSQKQAESPVSAEEIAPAQGTTQSGGSVEVDEVDTMESVEVPAEAEAPMAPAEAEAAGEAGTAVPPTNEQKEHQAKKAKAKAKAKKQKSEPKKETDSAGGCGAGTCG